MVVLLKRENIKNKFTWLIENNFVYYHDYINSHIRNDLKYTDKILELSEFFTQLNRDIYIHITNNKIIRAYDLVYDDNEIVEFEDYIQIIRKEKIERLLNK